MSLHPAMPAVLLLILAAGCAAGRVPPLLDAVRAGTPGARRAAVLRWSALTAAVAALLLAAARPGIDTGNGTAGDGTAAAPASNLNVFLVVDRSVNSRVRDMPGGATRMSAIRADIAEVIDAYPGARFGLIGFDAQPTVEWPLSEDSWSLDAVVAGMSAYPEAAPADRVDAGSAAIPLRYKLIQATQQYRGSANLVFYFGSGASGSGATQGSFAESRPLAGGAVFGYGTTEGGPIPTGYVDGAETYADGGRSVRDERRLRGVAAQLGVPYVPRDGRGPIAADLPVGPTAAGAESVAPGAAGARPRRELYWALAALGALLLVPEIVLSVRELRGRRREDR